MYYIIYKIIINIKLIIINIELKFIINIKLNFAKESMYE